MDYDEWAHTIDDDEWVTAMFADSPDDATHPHPQPFTVDDLMQRPDDGQRRELFDGSLLVSPAPQLFHQLVAMYLQAALLSAVPADYVPLDTANVRVDDQNFFIPDLVVARAEAVYADRLMLDPADVLLAVEIVSLSSRSHDRILKLEKYADAGIPYYWRVEPLEGPALYTYELVEDGKYRLGQAAPAGEKTELTKPFPIIVDPADWARRRS